MPIVLLACAIWSIIPNIASRLPLGFVGSILTNFWSSNIFFFYGVLSRIDHSGNILGLGIIFIVFFSLIIIYARHLGVQERELRSLKGVGE